MKHRSGVCLSVRLSVPQQLQRRGSGVPGSSVYWLLTKIRYKSVPIQLAQCRFVGLAISSAEI